MSESSPIHYRRRRTLSSSGQDEMNLVEFPFATLSRKPTLGSIKCQRWVSDASGQRHPQRWVVQGGSESGLPTEFDERIYVALMAMTRKQGVVSRKVTFSVYGLLKLMGETTDSKHYRSVERSLERLLRASITAEGAFWDAAKKELVHLANGFHLIERYWLAYKEGNDEVVEREGAPGYIVWGDELWRSFQAGYLKELNLTLFFALETPIARRLYRFLDKKLYRRAMFEIDIFQLGQQLGMAHYAYPAKVKEKLQPGIDELIRRRFLASAGLVKVQGYTRMRFVRGKGPVMPKAVEQPQPMGTSQPDDECGDYGCTAEVWRREMAAAHGVPDEHVRLWEKALDLARKRASEIIYQAWLSRTLLVDLNAGHATLLVPSAFLRDRIVEKHEALLQQALGEFLHSEVSLAYRIAAE